ncbi:hypothetical protein [Lysinibacillus sp. K60]|uniref:hypothetical protein n=1 Tax=Lysinibacillus sp. K60 TaxID=2720027 RepID=UPI001C8C4D97|nr:hypothetical protein [Lysinibacillus sp. K60]MBX8945904.1 hypothetical protein [Lysinibacillus sp. K60]
MKFTVEFNKEIAAKKDRKNSAYLNNVTPFVINVSTDYKDFRYDIEYSEEYNLLCICSSVAEYDSRLGEECTVAYFSALDILLNRSVISKINKYRLDFMKTKSTNYPSFEIQDKDILPYFYEVIEKEIINDKKANAITLD